MVTLRSGRSTCVKDDFSRCCRYSIIGSKINIVLAFADRFAIPRIHTKMVDLYIFKPHVCRVQLGRLVSLCLDLMDVTYRRRASRTIRTKELQDFCQVMLRLSMVYLDIIGGTMHCDWGKFEQTYYIRSVLLYWIYYMIRSYPTRVHCVRDMEYFRTAKLGLIHHWPAIFEHMIGKYEDQLVKPKRYEFITKQLRWNYGLKPRYFKHQNSINE